jgi:arylsulfatase A-like enzyme
MDMLPCLTDGKPSLRKEILHNTTPAKGALRMGGWKLVVNGNAMDPADEEDAQPKAKKKNKKRAAADADGVELFNLADDPYEKNDLSSKQPAKVKELRQRYDALAKQAESSRKTRAIGAAFVSFLERRCVAYQP